VISRAGDSSEIPTQIPAETCKRSPAEGSYAELLRRGPSARPRATATAATAALRVPRAAAAATAAAALVALAAVLSLALLSRGAAPTSGAADAPAAPSFVRTAQLSPPRTDASTAPFAAPFAAAELLGVCPASPRAAATTEAPLTTNRSVALPRLALPRLALPRLALPRPAMATPLSVVGAAAAAGPTRRTITPLVSYPQP
jgi:hypothetical protein